MLGKIVEKFDKCVTDDKGNIIVSFEVSGAERYETRQCVVAINTLLASGKYKLKIDVDVYRENSTKQPNAVSYLRE